MARKAEKPLPAKASREERAAQRMAERIREAERLAREYEATRDPREINPE
jgi:hypothetical protein